MFLLTCLDHSLARSLVPWVLKWCDESLIVRQRNNHKYRSRVQPKRGHQLNHLSYITYFPPQTKVHVTIGCDLLNNQ